MTIDEIKELIQVVKDTGVLELEVQRGENRVRIRSGNAAPDVIIPAVSAASIPAAVIASPPQSVPAFSPEQQTLGRPAAANTDEDERNTIVRSPIVGTYYDGPSEGAAPFVKVNDHVKAGQVLCIIESMKLMNEIEADVGGTIVAKYVENGRPVEYGESLFAIRPA